MTPPRTPRPAHTTPPGRRRAALRCESLDDRVTPALPTAVGVATGTDLVAQIHSAQPLQDLANVVAFYNLSGGVNLAGSSVVLSADGSALLDVALFAGANADGVSAQLLAAGVFDFVSPNYVYTPAGNPDLREQVPNDPKFIDQFHHQIIRTPDAWDRTYGSSGVITALLDDGVDVTHPDLKDNAYANPREIAGDGIDNDGNGYVDDVNGWDFVHNTNNVMPDDATDTHGTRVAGLLAARVDNGTGVAGVAGRSTFLPLKVVGNSPTTSLTIAKAVSYAVAAGARIINNSLNIDPFANDRVFRAATKYAHDRGLLWVNSAGNGNVNDPPRVAFEDVLLVAATDRTDVKTGYSNYGRGIDIAAPGGTSADGLVTTDGGGSYGVGFGTSLAAPLVSGTAALIWSQNPTFTRDQVAAILEATADDISAANPAYPLQLGAGRVNAGRAVSGAAFVTKLGPLAGLPGEGQTAEGLSAFSLRLLGVLSPATVTTQNFELRYYGPDGTFGTSDDTLIPLSINSGRAYRYGTNDLNFTLDQPLDAGRYRFTARSGGLTDPFNRPVDGDGDGSSGGDLIREFGVAYQVRGVVYDDTQDSGFVTPTSPGVPGQTVFADLNNNGLLDAGTFTSTFPPLAIPDAGAAVRLPVTVAGLTGPACDVTVSILLSHPNPSNLTVSLVAPDGTRITLARNRALPPAGTPQIVLAFSDAGEEGVTNTPTLVTYTLNPDDPLAAFRGTEPNGVWFVEVSDDTPGSTGTLRAATLTITTEPFAVTNPRGEFTLVGLPAGQPATLVVAATDGSVRSAGGGAVPVPVPAPMPTPTAEGTAGPPVAIGLVRVNAIYGRVLRDDGDGGFGPADAGLAGVTVYLDRFNNGVPDGGDPTATTDANGNFVFADVPAGNYRVRVITPAGFGLLSAAARTAAVTDAAPTSTGNDFLFRRNTAPVGATVPAVAPAVRTTPVDAVAVNFTEPVPLAITDFTLTRDGEAVSLAGATLVGSGARFTLVGLGSATAADGAYVLTVRGPAPAGEPGRRPAAASTTWATDATPPTVTLVPVVTVGVTAATATFSEPVFGLTTENFNLRRNGVLVPLDGVTLSGTGAVYTLGSLGPLTRLAGVYVLTITPAGPGVTDAAGNAFAAGAEFTWTVDQPLPPPPPPPTPVVKPGQRTAVGAGPGGSPLVTAYATATGLPAFTIFAYEPDFTGGVRVAVGDVTGDGIDDIVTGPGPGGGPRVRIFDGVTGNDIGGFAAFEEGFTGGLFVTTADLDRDGISEIIVTADIGGGPRVRIFDARTFAPIADFFGIADPDFRGGARAAAADVNADGVVDLVVAAGTGGGPRVAGFDGRTLLTGTPTPLFADFFAFEDTLRNGVYLAAADVTGDGFADLVIGGGPTGGPRVLVLSGRPLAEFGLLSPVVSFFAGNPDGRGGVKVAVKDRLADGFADILTGGGDGQPGEVRSYPAKTLAAAEPEFAAFDPFDGFTGGVYVG